MTDLCQPCADAATRGRAWIRVDPKRPGDPARVAVDWHDWLARVWAGPGQVVAAGTVVRPRRADATGLQYRTTAGGVAGAAEPRWSRVAGAQVVDGSVVWVAEVMSTDSLARTVSSQAWSVPSPLASSAELNSDHIHSALITGGVDGVEYSIEHRVVFSDSQADTGVLVMLVSSNPAAV